MFDVQASKVEFVNKGQNYIRDIVDSDLKELDVKKKLKVKTGFCFVKNVDAIAITVPTPLDMYKQPCLKYLMCLSKII
ncbi:UDP-glucose/GDP-mannose dehydrogenase family, NAD binding domain [Caloramator proteoclasticus DSM 10124]|uniref:UDP-glucose/GDP-mannose dehydrogenase family, NAD binding domain n=1 Tax=Caloramator proteoclasticus DSM 10124 TaxID=1121262 RepID=A0A1M4WKX2_9CLOT|nr:UDP-glucose/GDP-mannose dehydrogenase family, NAD binding domain [Caloramator proteoclasticus DSM 10124]